MTLTAAQKKVIKAMREGSKILIWANAECYINEQQLSYKVAHEIHKLGLIERSASLSFVYTLTDLGRSVEV